MTHLNVLYGVETNVSVVITSGATEDVRDNHAALNVFKDTEVEAHFRPATLRNPFKNKKLQSFFEKEGQACFLNSIELKGGTISVPTCEFNLVYQLVHIFEHFYTEGVGLRQVMDYYFVLRTVMNGTEGSGRYREAKKVISGLGLDRFASALMWVIKTVFIGHDNTSTSSAQADYGNFFPWKPNEKDGRFLLNEIMLSGNFGKQDDRQKGMYDSKWSSFWLVHLKTFRYWRFDPWAWFWRVLYGDCMVSSFEKVMDITDN